MTTQAIRRKHKRAHRRELRKAANDKQVVWHAFFSQSAFDLPPMEMTEYDYRTGMSRRAGYCSRGNWYHRSNGEAVRITAVYRSLKAAKKRPRGGYHWDDKQYLGVVSRWGRCIWHDVDPRSKVKTAFSYGGKTYSPTLFDDKTFKLYPIDFKITEIDPRN